MYTSHLYVVSEVLYLLYYQLMLESCFSIFCMAGEIPVHSCGVLGIHQCSFTMTCAGRLA